MRMSIASFEQLVGLVEVHVRQRGDEHVGRPPAVEPRIRLMLVAFWLAHGRSQRVACVVAEVAESTFYRALREFFHDMLTALPRQTYSESFVEQTRVAYGFVYLLGFLFRNVGGVIDGSLVPIQIPPASQRVGYNSRKCFYAVMLLAICD